LQRGTYLTEYAEQQNKNKGEAGEQKSGQIFADKDTDGFLHCREGQQTEKVVCFVRHLLPYGGARIECRPEEKQQRLQGEELIIQGVVILFIDNWVVFRLADAVINEQNQNGHRDVNGHINPQLARSKDTATVATQHRVVQEQVFGGGCEFHHFLPDIFINRSSRSVFSS